MSTPMQPYKLVVFGMFKVDRTQLLYMNYMYIHPKYAISILVYIHNTLHVIHTQTITQLQNTQNFKVINQSKAKINPKTSVTNTNYLIWL